MNYIGKKIVTETKELTIVRDTKFCVYVKIENTYKYIAIGKAGLNQIDSNTFKLDFKNAITHTVFQLNELGFENSRQRKNEWALSIKR